MIQSACPLKWRHQRNSAENVIQVYAGIKQAVMEWAATACGSKLFQLRDIVPGRFVEIELFR